MALKHSGFNGYLTIERETGGQSFWGWLLIVLSVLYIIIGIVLKIVAHFKK